MSVNEKEIAPPQSTRWWESYLVRYFVGFIVGTVCVIAIFAKTNAYEFLFSKVASVSQAGKADWTSIIFIVAFLGVGFCYVASTPITVLHVARYKHGWFDGHSRFFWISWVIFSVIFVNIGTPFFEKNTALQLLLIVFSLVVLILDFKESNKSGYRYRFLTCVIVWFVLMLGLSGFVFNHMLPPVHTSTKNWWVLSAPAIWICIGQYVTLFRLLNNENDYFDFCAKLFKARSSKQSKDVRDTYTHLREHSNSIFIVVIELSILSLIMAVLGESPAVEISQYYCEELWSIFITMLFVWMVPTIFMWGRANSLESKFKDDPNKFLFTEGDEG